MDKELIYKGFFGLERETLRVDINNRLAQTPHMLGESGEITRDFCENQIEIVTPVCGSIEEVMIQLKRLDTKVRKVLDEHNEHIWFYSNPPHFDSEDEIPVADFRGEHSGKRIYREYLERRYGKRLMLFSGIHFNLSFDDSYLKSICGSEDLKEFKNSFYLRLYKQFSRYSWLPLLLTAASPVYDRSLFEDGEEGAAAGEYASIRSGRKGYWNEFVPELRFGSLEEFIDSIRFYVDKGALSSASELYLPVRLKPKGVNKLESFKNGVSHIELRMLDINPFEPLGINADDLRFAHLMMIYLSEQPDFDYTAEMQQQAVENHKNAALLDLDGVEIEGVPILEKAAEVLDDMSERFADSAERLRVIEYERNKLKDRLAVRIVSGELCKKRV